MTTKPIFGLTECEKAQHVDVLSSVLAKLEPSPQEAVNALESCAILVQDDFMTPHVDHQSIDSLFKAAFGKTPAAIRENTSIPIEGHAPESRSITLHWYEGWSQSLIRGCA